MWLAKLGAAVPATSQPSRNTSGADVSSARIVRFQAERVEFLAADFQKDVVVIHFIVREGHQQRRVLLTDGIFPIVPILDDRSIRF